MPYDNTIIPLDRMEHPWSSENYWSREVGGAQQIDTPKQSAQGLGTYHNWNTNGMRNCKIRHALDISVEGIPSFRIPNLDQYGQSQMISMCAGILYARGVEPCNHNKAKPVGSA